MRATGKAAKELKERESEEAIRRFVQEMEAQEGFGQTRQHFGQPWGWAVSQQTQHSERVGEGPTYEAIRAEAGRLLPLFVAPGTTSRGRWGAGLVDVEPVEGGHRVSLIYPVVSRWEAQSNSIATVASVEELRATGIALLAYCEGVDALGRKENGDG